MREKCDGCIHLNDRNSITCKKCFHESRPENPRPHWKGDTRDTKKVRYLNIAAQVARGSTCLRRQYGAIIVREDEIIATGYNGAPRGEANCCDVGSCWREEHGIPHGQQYERCVAVHAEMNAIISAARRDMIGATMYLVGYENDRKIPGIPCLICSRLIKNAGIDKIETWDE